MATAKRPKNKRAKRTHLDSDSDAVLIPFNDLVQYSISQKRNYPESAADLLREFGQGATSSHPLLIEYVAECVRVWELSGFNARKAAKAFGIAHAGKGKPPNPATFQRHVQVIETYLHRLAEGAKPSRVLDHVVDVTGLDKKTIESLVAGLRTNAVRPFTPEQITAIRTVQSQLDFRLQLSSNSKRTPIKGVTWAPGVSLAGGNPALVAKSNALRSALGKGWKKWEQFCRQESERQPDDRTLQRAEQSPSTPNHERD